MHKALQSEQSFLGSVQLHSVVTGARDPETAFIGIKRNSEKKYCDKEMLDLILKQGK